MNPTDVEAERIERVGQELIEAAEEIRRGEGDWRWSPAALAARNAIVGMPIDISREPQTFDELKIRYASI